MRKILTLSLALCFFLNAFPQDYFQQQVDYTIHVTLDDEKYELSAYEKIEYTNNSPDELTFIYFHLWPNAYRNNSTALAKQKLYYSLKKMFEIEERRGYIDSLDFKVNSKPVKMEYDEEHIDICRIILNEPLKSGETITIETPFHVKIPKAVTSRLGHYKNSYQITQWYPKPAVYDKNGWHQMPYLNMGEFYSEFGSFDVSITLPKNYVVGATGDLQNPEEKEWLNQLAEKTAKIDNFDREDLDFPESSDEMKTIRYTQKNIHDFAWFADKRFHVLKSEVELPDTKRKVTTWAMFTNEEAHLWKKAPGYINDALYYYSKFYGDYPYNNCTAVLASISAGSGMEYPNITVIGISRQPWLLEMVIMHEVGHNWLYGILGFNERRYPWLDEGINSFSEARYMREKYGEENRAYKLLNRKKLTGMLGVNHLRHQDFHYIMYLYSARDNIDQPASLHSEEYTFNNYGTILYQKTSRVIDYLFWYLGQEEFDRIMQKFYEEWKYKHPYPEDLRKAFEEGTDKDVSWIFDDLIQTNKKLDYAVCKEKDGKILVANKGMIQSPVSVTGLNNNEPVFSKWYEGFEGIKWLELPKNKEFDKIVLNYDAKMPEIYRQDNMIRTSGLFKRVEPVNLKFAGVIEDNRFSRIGFFPAMGWNNYNKYMLGAAFFNPFFPKKRFQYQVMPMYAFGSNDLAGYANFEYHIMPFKSKIENLRLSVSGIQYAYDDEQGDNFQRIKAEAKFIFRNENARSRKDNKLTVNTIAASNVNDILADTEPDFAMFYNVEFVHSNGNPNNPYQIKTTLQASSDFVKASIDAEYKVVYQYSKGLDIRLFAGTFLYKAGDMSDIYRFRLSGTRGWEDYTYSEIFSARYETDNDKVFAHQFIPEHGAFSVYTPHGQTDEWLVAVNLTSSLPLIPEKIPLKIYANVASFGNFMPIEGYDDLDKVEWEAGAKLSLFRGMIDLYFPLVMSSDLQNFTDDLTNGYFERVRFSLKLSALHPVRLF